jgi:hypothetical protein
MGFKRFRFPLPHPVRPSNWLRTPWPGTLPNWWRPAECSCSRYDELKSGKVQPVDGEAFFENLRKREYDELLKKQ